MTYALRPIVEAIVIAQPGVSRTRLYRSLLAERQRQTTEQWIALFHELKRLQPERSGK